MKGFKARWYPPIVFRENNPPPGWSPRGALRYGESSLPVFFIPIIPWELSMPKKSQDEHRKEAERLALVDRETQREIIAQQKAIAENPKVPKRERAYAKERADALEKHLRKLRRKS